MKFLGQGFQMLEPKQDKHTQTDHKMRLKTLFSFCMFSLFMCCHLLWIKMYILARRIRESLVSTPLFITMTTRCWSGLNAPITAWCSVLSATCLTRLYNVPVLSWWCVLTCTLAHVSLTSPCVVNCYCYSDDALWNSSVSCEYRTIC